MRKKIVFMGTPSYATTIFKELLKHKNSFDIVALFTQMDKPVGRKQVITPPDIKKYCLENSINIPIFQPKSLRQDESLVDVIKELKPDFIIVAAYGQILPKNILDIAHCINLHASLLPLYRGASPIQETILNNDKYCGVTSMLMNEGLDTGDILGFQYLELSNSIKVDELFVELSKIAADLAVETLEKFDNILPKKQNSANSTHCKKIKRDDGLIEFCNAKKIYLKHRAYYFWPEIFTRSGLKLKDIELYEENSINRSGEVLKILEDSIVVGCKKGSIKIKALQVPSKKTLDVAEFLKGQKIAIGDIIS